MIVCPSCHVEYSISKAKNDSLPKYCSFCGHLLKKEGIAETTLPEGESAHLSTSSLPTEAALILENKPATENIQFSIGPYQILQEIGKGGMGEVFLAFDTTCGRRIALKRIRDDLKAHIQMHNRFLKEAHITSQLTHPSIIPIYAIHGQDHLVYYTMPFVQGPTLKEILRQTRMQEKKGEPLHHIGGSILALMRIFLSICQAIGYAHSKGVLHRDIKPENIIVGQYGEVLILDWGLAKLVKSDSEDSFEEAIPETGAKTPSLHQLTHAGKVVGTVNYMAPETAKGVPPTVKSDIYSLGVILYQILTLRYPFKRGSIKQFRETMHTESIRNPLEVAPYRDVPLVLAKIAMKCLSPDLEQRYQDVNELIRDIENYIEGRAEWFHTATLDIENKEDWEFQENVLIAEHIAITRSTEISDWVSLMISKSSFTENIKLEAKVRLGKMGHGIGFLLSIPESSERSHLNDGYCLWLGNDQNRSTKLLHSAVEVVHTPDVFLQREDWNVVRIEKFENKIYLYINDILQFSYISHLPLAGTHVGILARDADFFLKDLKIYEGSQSVMVNCLAVPNAFLSHKNYAAALSEYRRIGYSFPGRAEGREAMFRAGITLLEQARLAENIPSNQELYDKSLAEFEKLHGTPGAPLEYLGKALVYQATNDFDEEIKCFELAYRRYPKHPLLPILQEQIVYRMHASSRYDRQATYKFALLVARHLPKVLNENTTKKLFISLKKHWEPLPFLLEDPSANKQDGFPSRHSLATILAFWLAKHYVLEEIIHDLLQASQPNFIDASNAIYCLIELGAVQLAEKCLDNFTAKHPTFDAEKYLHILIEMDRHPLEYSFKEIYQLPLETNNPEIERVILYFMGRAVALFETKYIFKLYQELMTRKAPLNEWGKMGVDCAQIWAYLSEKKWEEAGEILHHYPLELLNQETTPLHFLYGCWLYATEGKEIAFIHFLGLLETPFPHSWTLFSHLYPLAEDVRKNRLQKAFMWERRQFYKQMILFYRCAGDKDKEELYVQKERQEYLHDS